VRRPEARARTGTTVEGKPRKVVSLEVHEAEDGLVVYDPARDLVHHLNPTASVIFDLCNGAHDAEAVAAVLAEVFRVDAPPLDAASAGLEELAERGLIE